MRTCGLEIITALHACNIWRIKRRLNIRMRKRGTGREIWASATGTKARDSNENESQTAQFVVALICHCTPYYQTRDLYTLSLSRTFFLPQPDNSSPALSHLVWSSFSNSAAFLYSQFFLCFLSKSKITSVFRSKM